MLRTRPLAGAIAASLFFYSTASAGQFNQSVIFGDSLSDGGNSGMALTAMPLRFTTNPGYTSAELVATGVGAGTTNSISGGSNYAWGGAGFNNNAPGTPAGVPLITQQWQQYLSATGGKTDANALYQVWGGANDIFYQATAYGNGTSTLTQALAGVATAAGTEVGMLSQMQAAGAKYVVVYNVPDIGVTPQAQSQGAAAAAGLTQMSAAYNSQLNAGLGQLSANGLNIIPVNTYALLHEVMANPSAYGIVNTTTAACNTASALTCTADNYPAGANQNYLFADGIHPTTGTHQMLSQAALSEINAPGQISMLSLAPLAAVRSQYRILRDQTMIDVTNPGNTGTRVFTSIDYGKQTFESTTWSPKTTSNNYNLTVGATSRVNGNFLIGTALGISRNNASFAAGQGSYNMTDATVHGFATYYLNNFYATGIVNYGYSSYKDITRSFLIGPSWRSETGKTDGNHLGSAVDTGYWTFNLDNGIKAGPFARLEWQTVKVNGYNEDGYDSTSMWFGQQQRDSFIGSFGFRLTGQFNAGSLVLSPLLELNPFNRDWKANANHGVTAGLNTMNGYFTMPGYTGDRDWSSISLGLSAQIAPGISSWIALSGRFNDDTQKDRNITVGMKMDF